jgi:hypothetical protein
MFMTQLHVSGSEALLKAELEPLGKRIRNVLVRQEDSSMKQRYRHVYAIVRVDEFQNSEVPLSHKITVTKIVGNEQVARSEVARLNSINARKGCSYFWQVTRLSLDPQASALQKTRRTASGTVRLKKLDND